MADRPRVMVVGPFPPTTGGVTTFMRNLINSSLKDEWEFVCHSTTRPLSKRPYRGHVSYSGFIRDGLWRATKCAAVTVWHALSYPAALLRSGAPIAQIQSSDYFAFWEASLYVAVTRAMRRTAVVRFGGSFDVFYEGSSPRAQSLIRRVLAAADAIVVQSGYWRDYFGRLTDPSKLDVIPNAVPLTDPPPERGERTGPVTAVFLCGTEPTGKGIDEIIEMAQRVRGRLRIRCIATPDEVRKRIVRSGVSDVVEPLGILSRDALDIEYRGADIFLIPSHGEGFPNSLLEAMARALPVVATPVGAIPEIVEEGVNGLLVPVADANALTEAALKLAEDQGLRLRMGAANRQKVIEAYEVDEICKHFGRVWRRALRRRNREK
jgi:glycosyltransferase involved in cell wall biosynthesis